ncbi:MAG: Gfo/Idh/MocA family protein [Hyphomicrobiales bacterium]
MAQGIRVAAVGLGWVALNRHLPVMDRSRRFEVVGVVDRAPGRAESIAKRRGYRLHACATSLASVAWLDEVDAVTVATAPMAHHGLVKEALAGGKHVLTEKPFTMTVEEGEELVAAAKRSGRQMAIVHNFQFARSTLRLKAEIASGRLGAITGIDAVQFGNPARRLPSWYDELPFGLFYDESPHLLYLMRAIAGPIALERAIMVPSRRGLATPARIAAWFKAQTDDYPIALSCNFESPVSEWYLLVQGERRLAIVDIFRDIYLSLPNDGAHDAASVVRTSLVATAQHWIQNVTRGIPHLAGRLVYGNDQVFERFARAIAGEVAALEPIGPESALSVLKLQHAVIDRSENAYSPCRS